MARAIVWMIPWTAYLAVTLPNRYVTYNWTATWVGFDVLLLMFMVATIALGLARRHLLILSAFTTGVLLTCDAWFDVMTAARGGPVAVDSDRRARRLPLAVLLITGALRILRLTSARLWLLDAHTRLWQVPLLP